MRLYISLLQKKQYYKLNVYHFLYCIRKSERDDATTLVMPPSPSSFDEAKSFVTRERRALQYFKTYSIISHSIHSEHADIIGVASSEKFKRLFRQI